jgi:hypothetical protein
MSSRRELVMRISLSALEHLGINLYSNVPAVLSEIVANAWDADARKVRVRLDKAAETIVIDDDGAGMDRDAVVDRFLTVGFQRRSQSGGDKTLGGRMPMGRKGIGKLSIFSVARTATIYTSMGKDRTAFKMDRDEIRKYATGNALANYKPEELKSFPTDFGKGTRIVLSGLSKSLSGMTLKGLKRRIARRFSVIGSKHSFSVTVDGVPITPRDREYHGAIEYLWTYGNQNAFVKTCTHLARDADARLAAITSQLRQEGITLTGWIGTVSKPEQLKDEEGDNLNRLAVFMRGKLAQENILDTFGEKEIYASYLIGELHCEELDADGDSDIATSSRQALKQDDPRFEALKRIVKTELRHVAGKWSDWRRSDGAKSAAKVPAVSDWLDNLSASTRKKAERWIGRLNTIRSEDETVKKELLKASILAFESFRRKEELELLDNVTDESLDKVLDIFRSIDELELSYYGQIVQGRVKVIKTLQQKLKRDQKETILRDYIFDHLWLLDPSWERTTGSEHSETLVHKFLKDNTKTLKGEQKRARIDIGYRTASGKHVIVELKRASVAVPLDDLTKQIRKYRDGARRILDKTLHKDWPLEIICLVGKPPPEWSDDSGTGKKGVIAGLKTVDARIVFYDELLSNAQRAYADHLEAKKKVDKLAGVFAAIDDFAPPDKAKKPRGRRSATQ